VTPNSPALHFAPHTFLPPHQLAADLAPVQEFSVIERSMPGNKHKIADYIDGEKFVRWRQIGQLNPQPLQLLIDSHRASAVASAWLISSMRSS
jgi:hypothetical protein